MLVDANIGAHGVDINDTLRRIRIEQQSPGMCLNLSEITGLKFAQIDMDLVLHQIMNRRLS